MSFRTRELSVLSEFDLRGGGLAALRSRVDWRGGLIKAIAATAADLVGTAARKSLIGVGVMQRSSSARGRDSRLTLLEACEQGEDDEILTMLDEAGKPSFINQTDPEGWSAIMFACDNGHYETVRLLIERGAAVNQRSRLGTTALMIACSAGFEEIARLLIENGADVRLCAQSGWTALMEACSGGYLSTARMLLEHGAPAAQSSVHGDTALMRACMRGDVALVKLLCSYGARRDAVDRHGNTAVDAARTFAQRPEPADKQPREIAAWLERTRHWVTPLHHLEVLTAARATALLEAGADLHARAPLPGAVSSAPFESPLGGARDGVRSWRRPSAAVRAAVSEAGAATPAAMPDAPSAAAELPPSPLELAQAMERVGNLAEDSAAAVVLRWWRVRLFSFLLGTHGRLGAASPIYKLACAPELLELVVARWRALPTEAAV
jgi:hypothetical protein